MNTNSKLGLKQIAEGWIEIESEEQLDDLSGGHYQFLWGNDAGFVVYDAILTTLSEATWHFISGKRDNTYIAKTFIAYRPLLSYEEYQALKKKADSCTRMLGAWQHKTLRDEIAIAAMSGMIHSLISNDSNIDIDIYRISLAADAYDYADAMLKARGEGQ